MNKIQTLTLPLLALAGTAVADNAALTTGGQPTMLGSHPSVSMESEIVRLVVHANRVDTDCTFVFVNHGKACNVNMGFPDFGLWAYAQKMTRPRSMFKKYGSFVDGKSVKTKLVLGKEDGEQWQTKFVSFPAGGKRTVREVYTTELGGIAGPQVWAFASYLLHTGASWKGNIGKATILVTFAPDSKVKPPMDILFQGLGKLTQEMMAKQHKKPGGLIVSGPVKPTAEGRTLKFFKQNWRPTAKDDIYVGFAYPKH